jgi:hypothetical protein
MKKLLLLLLLLNCGGEKKEETDNRVFEKKNYNCQVYVITDKKPIVVCD